MVQVLMPSAGLYPNRACRKQSRPAVPFSETTTCACAAAEPRMTIASNMIFSFMKTSLRCAKITPIWTGNPCFSRCASSPHDKEKGPQRTLRPLKLKLGCGGQLLEVAANADGEV